MLIEELMTAQEQEITEVDEWVKRKTKIETLQWYIIQLLLVISIPIAWNNI